LSETGEKGCFLIDILAPLSVDVHRLCSEKKRSEERFYVVSVDAEIYEKQKPR
jgi:hypothetical protein